MYNLTLTWVFGNIISSMSGHSTQTNEHEKSGRHGEQVHHVSFWKQGKPKMDEEIEGSIRSYVASVILETQGWHLRSSANKLDKGACNISYLAEELNTRTTRAHTYLKWFAQTRP